MTDSGSLVLLAGLPGSGKSTWAHAHGRDAVVLTADSIRTHRRDPKVVFEEMHEAASLALTNGQRVIVDACSLRKFERESLWHRGRAQGAAMARGQMASRGDPEANRGLWASAKAACPDEGWDEISWVDAGGHPG